MLGFSPPCYTNVAFPFTAIPALRAPVVPRANPTAVYRTRFKVPAEWLQERSVRLVFHAAGPAIIVWVDGEYIGYSQDSMTPAEFDITDVLRADAAASSGDAPSCDGGGSSSPLAAALLAEQRTGEHLLVVAIPTWCDGTYMEDQDQWWLTGLHRTVELHCVPEPCAITDYALHAVPRPGGGGELSVRVVLSKPAASGTRLRWRLFAPAAAGAGDGRVVAEKVASVEEGKSSFEQSPFQVPGPVAPWSAELPSLYDLTLELLGPAGQVLQAEGAKVGFRSVDIVGGQLRVNGAALVVAGANVHEMHPTRGKALTDQDMLKDIRLLKQGNFNAVRNSHYPHHARWYELCDEHGLYVVDEANIETHGFATNCAMSLLACDPRWREQFLHRTRNMFARAKNHACVIAWSLGNESGWGPNFSACRALLITADEQKRPVQYEGAEHHGDAVMFMGDGQGPESDIICPMYHGPHMILPYASDGRPVVLCEYSHAMGNSNGSLRTYWDLFWSTNPEHRSIQGGFIWEWAEGALRIPRAPRELAKQKAAEASLDSRINPDEYFLRGELGYGGDFGPDSGALDKHFICDGLVTARREPHPAFFEAKRLQQPLAFRLVRNERSDTGDVQVVIRNRHSFRSLDHLELFWRVWDASGEASASSEGLQLRGQASQPGAEASISLRLPTPSRSVASSGQWLKVEARLREATALMPRGFVVAEATFSHLAPLASSPSADRAAGGGGGQRPAVCRGSTPPLRAGPAPAGRVAVQEGGGREPTVQAPGYVARLRGRRIVSLRAVLAGGGLGEELLAGPALEPCFYRASTDNDRCGFDCFVPALLRVPGLRSILRGMGLLSVYASWSMSGLNDLESVVRSSDWGAGADGLPTLVVKEDVQARGRTCFVMETRYTFGAARISSSIHVESCAPVRRLPTLPRVGVKLLASPRLSRLTWLGCGPGESYPDRKSANDWAVHCGDVDRQHVDYMVPSENGGKADVHWAALTAPPPGSPGTPVSPTAEAAGAARAVEGLLIEYECLQEAPPEEVPEDAPPRARPAGTRGAQFSASRFSCAELEASRHSFELAQPSQQPMPQDRPIQVHLDTAHTGVGGAGFGGDKLWATATQYLVNPKDSPWHYTVHLRPLTASTWAHSGRADA